MEKSCEEECEVIGTVHIKDGLELNSLIEAGAIFEISNVDNQIEDLESNYACYDSEGRNFDTIEVDNVNKEQIPGFISNSFDELVKDFVAITDDGLVLKQVVKQSFGTAISPLSNVTGSGNTIEGFEVAVASMKKREVSRFLICPEYAYGSRGCPPRIPPDAICMFHFLSGLYIIEVLDFTAPGDVKDEYFSLPVIAKKHFHNNKFYLALKFYSNALNILLDHNLKDEIEENSIKPEMIKLHTNMALCHLKLRQSVRAIHHCNEIFKLQDGNNVKALYFKGKALKQVGEFKTAISYLERANRLKPNKREILTELEKANRNYNIFRSCILNCENDMKKGNQWSSEKEFVASIESSIKSFVADEEIMELPLPAFQFKAEQIQTLKDIANKHDLLVEETINTKGINIIHVHKKFKVTCVDRSDHEK
ncbi:hypothetical protein HELRODRAFT_158977 [Helobdella robusta]|uniref:peptidylprolyl isomerase n=1 Tax=Helobdella robusta TaxID=6412 RepID=T1ENG1_HELRO|nr:hypothetical protein HELRODRAFT_158977 [Helobdella robusta]ESO12443.1 hypothetical protein HELRODRAFT_158977 [Helobdella robusta]